MNRRHSVCRPGQRESCSRTDRSGQLASCSAMRRRSGLARSGGGIQITYRRNSSTKPENEEDMATTKRGNSNASNTGISNNSGSKGVIGLGPHSKDK